MAAMTEKSPGDAFNVCFSFSARWIHSSTPLTHMYDVKSLCSSRVEETAIKCHLSSLTVDERRLFLESMREEGCSLSRPYGFGSETRILLGSSSTQRSASENINASMFGSSREEASDIRICCYAIFYLWLFATLFAVADHRFSKVVAAGNWRRSEEHRERDSANDLPTRRKENSKSYGYHCDKATALSANITIPSSVFLPLNKTKIQSTVRPIRARQVFPVLALEDEEVSGGGVTVAVEEEKPLSGTESLKKTLIASFDGTSRRLTASSETRAEIVELITQLEAENPTPAPTEALPLLNGKWILV
ncbi:hypothetical protein ACFE04_019896 [Oxalis oulophora]